MADIEVCNPEMNTNKYLVFSTSNCRRVLNVVFFLLGDSPALNVMCRRFGTFCLFHKIQTPDNHQKKKEYSCPVVYAIARRENIQTETEFRVSTWKLTRTRGLQRVMIIFRNTKRADTYR
jgi:hypothetical protein